MTGQGRPAIRVEQALQDADVTAAEVRYSGGMNFACASCQQLKLRSTPVTGLVVRRLALPPPIRRRT
jgi:hypothetical protein